MIKGGRPVVLSVNAPDGRDLLNVAVFGAPLRRRWMNILASIATGSMLLWSASSSAQSGHDLFFSICFGCHDGAKHPAALVNNAAGNAAIISAVNAFGMGAQGSPADFASIAAYLDSVKPSINLAPVAHDSPGTKIPFSDIIVSGADLHADWKIISDVVTVSAPTKGTVTYRTANGFNAPSIATYRPFPGQSGVDTWTYQGIGVLNTTIRTATVMIAPADGQAATNYQGLWWVPGGTENFWGINFAHQGDRVFGTWYTYDTSGNVYWLSMLADRTTPTSNTYTGDINVDVGPPFNNFVGSGTYGKVGTGTITFSDANHGSFTYNLNTGTGGSPVAVTQTKALARFDLGTGPQPTCTFSPTANLAAATNFQDLWWAASGAESGWGINFAHQGNYIFATWYTYDAKGASNNPPMWLSALLQRQGTSNIFSGPISRTSGPRFDNYKASDVAQPIPTVGSATVTFTDGNSATFNYATSGNGGLPAGVNQTKAIARFPFGPGGTVCQ
jgi:hypothetical protein